MPAALGWHPWFDRRGLPVRLELDAASVLETSDMIPTGRVLAAAGPLDLRGGPVLGDRRLDDAYLDARSPAVLEWPDLRLTLDFSPAPGPVVVYTPEHAVCVEPQTATPNALALPEAEAAAAGVRFLDAGETFEARLSLSWR
jgi:aldose 1-epimerase